MQSLDPRSLIAMGVLMALVMAIVLGFTRRYYPPNIQGVGHWAMAATALFLGGIFFGFSAPAWPHAWRWVGNGTLVLGFLLFHVGFRRFLHRPVPWRLMVVLYGMSLLLIAWYEWMDPSYRMRVALITAIIGVVHVASLRVLWRQGSQRLPVRMVQATLVLHLCVLLIRMFTVLSEPRAGSMWNASSIQTLYIGGYVVASLLLSVGVLLMATDRVRTELEHMATHDALTAAFNRRAILDLCAQEHMRSVRYGDPFSLMMLDLDHFKLVNDTYGHQHGDNVLVHFADCVRAALRSCDRFGRYGGEEFLVLLPNTTREAALTVAQRIHAALSAGHPLDCQVSIGVASWCGPNDSLHAMLSRADVALYQAKSQGRNQTCAG